MPNYTVYFSAYFSDSVDIEAEDEQEAEDLAKSAIADDWSAYTSSGGYTVPFDDVQIEEIQEEN
jgi:hypothetical protein